jgi:hypothetical protein
MSTGKHTGIQTGIAAARLQLAIIGFIAGRLVFTVYSNLAYATRTKAIYLQQVADISQRNARNLLRSALENNLLK